MALSRDPSIDLESKVKIGAYALISLLLSVAGGALWVGKAYTEFEDRTAAVEKATKTLQENDTNLRGSLDRLQNHVDFLTEEAIRSRAGSAGVQRYRSGETPQEIVK